ncbi:hypothetical protein LX36DRAFT_54837 [Colletotrichum falcatum]|nr:hypothetical protein LX36DRAFT_54837 [Colletotrichum falcatum]
MGQKKPGLVCHLPSRWPPIVLALEATAWGEGDMAGRPHLLSLHTYSFPEPAVSGAGTDGDVSRTSEHAYQTPVRARVLGTAFPHSWLTSPQHRVPGCPWDVGDTWVVGKVSSVPSAIHPSLSLLLPVPAAAAVAAAGMTDQEAWEEHPVGMGACKRQRGIPIPGPKQPGSCPDQLPSQTMSFQAHQTHTRTNTHAALLPRTHSHLFPLPRVLALSASVSTPPCTKQMQAGQGQVWVGGQSKGVGSRSGKLRLLGGGSPSTP